MSKAIELKGCEALERYVAEYLPGATLMRTMNKGRGASDGMADAILTLDGKTFHIEIKASSGKAGTNVRFTHQTISKALGHDLIVALVEQVAEPEKTSLSFFRLGEVKTLGVEPHFIVQQAGIKAHRTARFPT